MFLRNRATRTRVAVCVRQCRRNLTDKCKACRCIAIETIQIANPVDISWETLLTHFPVEKCPPF